jgi:hypothetical protein
MKLCGRQFVQQMQRSLRTLPSVQLSIILEASQPFRKTKGTKSHCPLPTTFMIALVFFVDEIDYYPDTVRPNVFVGMVEIIA